MGLGLGLVFRSGATTGGSDLFARIAIHFIPYLSMGNAILIIDGCIIFIFIIIFLKASN